MLFSVGLALVLAGCAGAGNISSSNASGSQPAPKGLEAPASLQEPASSEDSAAHVEQQDDDKEAAGMRLSIGGIDVGVAWEDNQAVADLTALVADGPVVVDLHRYGGFEQVGPIGATLTTSDEQVTTSPGDIVLYAGDQISIFYGTNSWAYTRLGRITDRTADEMAGLLGNGDVSITITVLI